MNFSAVKNGRPVDESVQVRHVVVTISLLLAFSDYLEQLLRCK